jgi:small-conductance mechanosensitive channel
MRNNPGDRIIHRARSISMENWFSNPLIGKVLAAAGTVGIVALLVGLLQRITGRRIQDRYTRYHTRKLITFAGYLIGILALGGIFIEKMSSVTVALGVAGAGIAFALQEVITSIAGWFAISFAQFYKIGHRVQLGGIKGDVIDVSFLRTTLMEMGDWVNGDLYNGRVVRVANSFVFKEPVFNYSGDFPFLWDEINLPIRYGSDRGLTVKILLDTAEEVAGEYTRFASQAWQSLVKKFAIEDARVEPLVSLVLDENWMTYTLRYVVDFKRRRSTKDALFNRILEEIEKASGRVSIASSSQEISFLNKPPSEKGP